MALRSYAELLRTLATTAAAPCQEFLTPRGLFTRDGRTVFQLAMERGSQLMALGLVSGDRVGIVVTDPWDFLPLVHGCLLFGLVAVPMYPPPPFSRLETYRATLAGILRVANARVVITDVGLPARIGDVPEQRIVELDELPPQTRASLPNVEPDDLALLQFTSGSTADPRGVRITHRALMANAHAIMVDGLGAHSTDRGVSWLPLYHDMGLIGFGLAPLLTQTPVTFIPTSRFVRNPSIWLQTISDVRGTITFAPNFAYALATKRVSAGAFDLSCVRMWGCGAEPMSESVLSGFERHFASSGVEAGTISPCYGLAEATLAVTFTPPSGPRVALVVDSARWERDGVAAGIAESTSSPPRTESGTTSNPMGQTTLVSSGAPLPHYAVKVVDESGAEVGEARAGEIVVSGPSLGAGYAGDAEATGRTFRGDDLYTGDRGFLRAGQLFVTGRIKDTLIVNGRKYDPSVLEHWAEQVNGVRRAAAVNVQSEDGEALVVLVESGQDARETLAEAVRAAIAANVGVSVTKVLCVAQGALPRTTSGKIRRGAAKALVRWG